MKQKSILILACVVLAMFGLLLPTEKTTQGTEAPASEAASSKAEFLRKATAEAAQKSGVRDDQPVDKTSSETSAKRYRAGTSQNSDDFFTSAAGIKFGADYSRKFESRIAHIMAHTAPDPSKPKHSVFTDKTRDGVLKLLDEAWKKRGPPQQQGGSRGRDLYDIPTGRVIGTEGERSIRIIMERDSATIVTAYPVR